MAGIMELGEVVPAHGDDVPGLTSGYRSTVASGVTPAGGGAAMNGCKKEVESVHARCSTEGLAGSRTMMASAAAHCSSSAALECPPGTVPRFRAWIGGRGGRFDHCKYGAMPLVAMETKWIEGG